MGIEDQLLAEIKALKKKVAELEEAGKPSEALESRLGALEKRLESRKDADFGPWE